MGFFSWNTQDTNKSISNMWSCRHSFHVYMVNPITMESYLETAYEGYGVFGNKDFYELLAELNGLGSDRIKGIDLFYSGKEFISPILVEDKGKAKDYVGQAPTTCPYQGYFYEDEE